MRVCSASPVSNVRHMARNSWQLCVSFRNGGNVQLQLTRKRRSESGALKSCGSFFYFAWWSENQIPSPTEVLYYDLAFHTVLCSPPPSAPLRVSPPPPAPLPYGFSSESNTTPTLMALAPNPNSFFKGLEPSPKPPVLPRDFPSFPRFLQASSQVGFWPQELSPAPTPTGEVYVKHVALHLLPEAP